MYEDWGPPQGYIYEVFVLPAFRGEGQVLGCLSKLSALHVSLAGRAYTAGERGA